MEVALCAGEYGQRLFVCRVRLVEHRFYFLVLMVGQENLRTADLDVPQAVQSESSAMGCGVVSIDYSRLERLFGLVELTLGPKAVGHVGEINGRRARARLLHFYAFSILFFRFCVPPQALEAVSQAAV
jgi:hypothetical protein